MSLKTLFTAAAVLAGTIASAGTADAQFRVRRGATYYNPGVYSSSYLPRTVYSSGYSPRVVYGNGYTYPTYGNRVMYSNGYTYPYNTGYYGTTYGYPYSTGVYGNAYGTTYGYPMYSGYNNIITTQSGIGLGSRGISVGGLPIIRW